MPAVGVVDFINVGIRSSCFYILNVADMAVWIGVVAWAYSLWRNDRSRRDMVPDTLVPSL